MENALKMIAMAITPSPVIAGHDATGGRVESLTEAVMGMTAALVMIAEAVSNNATELGNIASSIDSLAIAVDEKDFVSTNINTTGV
jgi:hypothetical protein